MTADRDVLGRIVRAAWEAEVRTWDDVDQHPNWITPWEDLPERDREVDRLIGEAVAAHVREQISAEVRVSADGRALVAVVDRTIRDQPPDPEAP